MTTKSSPTILSAPTSQAIPPLTLSETLAPKLLSQEESYIEDDFLRVDSTAPAPSLTGTPIAIPRMKVLSCGGRNVPVNTFRPAAPTTPLIMVSRIAIQRASPRLIVQVLSSIRRDWFSHIVPVIRGHLHLAMLEREECEGLA